MIRIAGVVIPDYKHARISLSHIYGIGVHTAERICRQANVDAATRMSDLSDGQVDVLRKLVQNELIDADLRREVQMNIKRLMDIGSYRGIRHRRGRPVRGQRTRTNARTRKGGRRSKVSRKVVGRAKPVRK